MNPNIVTWFAIDVAKDSLQIQGPSRAWSFKNSPSDHSKICALFAKAQNPHVILEPSGGYERDIRSALDKAQIPLSLVNPARVRAFATSEGVRAKNDPIDAIMLRRFALEKKPEPTPPPSQHQLDLAALMDRRSQLSDFLVCEKNRIQNSEEILSPSIQTMIKTLEIEIRKIESQIRQIVREHHNLKEAASHLQGIAGVGETTIWAILAYLPELPKVKRNTAAALAGLAPFANDSGTLKKRRFIMGGRRKLRNILYMACITARRCNPVIKAYIDGLIARGKPFKCAMVAAMRKLLLHIRSVLKNAQLSLD